MLKTFLRWFLWLLAVLAVAAGIAALAAFDTPMQVVMPLRTVAMLAGGLSIVFAGLLLTLGSRRLPALGVAIAGIAFLAVAATRLAVAPPCEPFTVDNGAGKLAGTVCRPATAGPAPAAVFVHGSGPMTRDEYRYFAERLADSGIAGVIYDKRGAGASDGRTYAVGYRGYAEDLEAVTRWARAQSFINPRQVGFIGYSEAEWVMPLAAADADPAFIAVVGASGLSPMDQVSEEIALRLESRGFDEEDVRSAVGVNERFADYLRGELDAERLRAILEGAKNQPWFQAAGDLPEAVHPREDYAWWRGVMDFEPAPAWRKYKGPVLFLKGTDDDRSRAHRAAERFRGMLPRPADRLTVALLEGADHSLLTWPFGKGTPPPAFADGYPEVMVDWIRETAR